MNDAETFRLLGELQAEVRNLKIVLAEREARLDVWMEKNTEVLNELMAAKNKGIGVLLAVGAIGSVIGAFLSSVLEWQHWGK